MYLQKVISKTNDKKLFFVGILEVTDEKNRIRIRKSSIRIQGSGYVSKCHGSGTLVKTQIYSVYFNFPKDAALFVRIFRLNMFPLCSAVVKNTGTVKLDIG